MVNASQSRWLKALETNCCTLFGSFKFCVIGKAYTLKDIYTIILYHKIVKKVYWVFKAFISQK